MKTYSIIISSTLLLFCGFYWNLWGVLQQDRFANHQGMMESWILGRLVKSRQDGIFSSGGLPGSGGPEGLSARWMLPETHRYQYSAYLNGLKFPSYGIYKSQIGGQGMFFSLLDSLINLSPSTKFQIFRMLTSLLSALALAMIVYWFLSEFEWLTAVFALSSMIFSQWLVVFGRNLWWSLWAFYLPMVFVMYYLRKKRKLTSRHLTVFGIIVFISVFVKCFINGYEYISTTLIMMLVPLVYYSIKWSLNIKKFVKATLVALLGSSLAILVSFTILCSQIATGKGDYSAGVHHIIYSLKKRTHGDPQDFLRRRIQQSLEAKTSHVLRTYLNGTFFDMNNYINVQRGFVSRFVFDVRYIYLVILFLIMSVILYLRRSALNSKKPREESLSLICATWFSITAPLSWFILFKAHSHHHTHLNYIVWQMPFTLFGFALCGLTVRKLLSDLLPSRRAVGD